MFKLSKYFIFISSLYILPCLASDQCTPLNLMGVTDEVLKFSGNGITIAVLDNGFNIEHQDLKGKFLRGYDSALGCSIPNEKGEYRNNSHGTHVVGTICAKPLIEYGHGGLAHNAKILPVSIYNLDKPKTREEILAQYYESLNFITRGSDVKIVNISQELFVFDNKCSEIFQQWIRDGKIIVHAAGNNGHNKKYLPSDEVLTGPFASNLKEGWIEVCALSKYSTKDNLYRWREASATIGGSCYYSNNYEGNIIWAPGNGICSTGSKATDHYFLQSGTSMAAPQVSAALALLWEKYSNYNSKQILEKLMSSPKAGSDYYPPSEYIQESIEEKLIIMGQPILNFQALLKD